MKSVAKIPTIVPDPRWRDEWEVSEWTENRIGDELACVVTHKPSRRSEVVVISGAQVLKAVGVTLAQIYAMPNIKRLTKKQRADLQGLIARSLDAAKARTVGTPVLEHPLVVRVRGKGL